jgi:hypothetical protein
VCFLDSKAEEPKEQVKTIKCDSRKNPRYGVRGVVVEHGDKSGERDDARMDQLIDSGSASDSLNTKEYIVCKNPERF